MPKTILSINNKLQAFQETRSKEQKLREQVYYRKITINYQDITVIRHKY